MAALEVILNVPPLHLMLEAAVKGDDLRTYEFGKEGSVVCSERRIPKLLETSTRQNSWQI